MRLANDLIDLRWAQPFGQGNCSLASTGSRSGGRGAEQVSAGVYLHKTLICTKRLFAQSSAITNDVRALGRGKTEQTGTELGITLQIGKT
jgi:hypothetical protein